MNRPDRDRSDRTNRRRATTLRQQAGGTRWARKNTESQPTEMTRLRASAFAIARVSNELTIRACARRDRARVSGALRALLFDIVNVQNWPAVLRSARSGSPCCKVASDRRSAAADHLSIFAGLAQLAERRPCNAEAACSTHAAGTPS